MAAIDHKISRLEKYIQVLADKAGVDLDRIHVKIVYCSKARRDGFIAGFIIFLRAVHVSIGLNELPKRLSNN